MLCADFSQLIAVIPTDRDWFMAVGLILLLALSSGFYLCGHKRSASGERRSAPSNPRERA